MTLNDNRRPSGRNEAFERINAMTPSIESSQQPGWVASIQTERAAPVDGCCTRLRDHHRYRYGRDWSVERIIPAKSRHKIDSPSTQSPSNSSQRIVQGSNRTPSHNQSHAIAPCPSVQKQPEIQPPADETTADGRQNDGIGQRRVTTLDGTADCCVLRGERGPEHFRMQMRRRTIKAPPGRYIFKRSAWVNTGPNGPDDGLPSARLQLKEHVVCSVATSPRGVEVVQAVYTRRDTTESRRGLWRIYGAYTADRPKPINFPFNSRSIVSRLANSSSDARLLLAFHPGETRSSRVYAEKRNIDSRGPSPFAVLSSHVA
ncbi:hypothetical protein WH47_08368 [Habropoda laboriosa]|uniref:Uncharacterized protein n=1 Tax=Habropoda laboriosa TaxID=597456 RepID=A0A0L7RGJ9_9HYME|nr:hypothetical protein WH47_08368 [Habropoda laboriosa]